MIFPNVCRGNLDLMSSAQNSMLKATHAVFMKFMKLIFLKKKEVTQNNIFTSLYSTQLLFLSFLQK